MFPVVADLVPWNSDEFLSRLPSELRVSFSPCCFYAEVSRLLFTLNSPIWCLEGQNLSLHLVLAIQNNFYVRVFEKYLKIEMLGRYKNESNCKRYFLAGPRRGSTKDIISVFHKQTDRNLLVGRKLCP